jgi:hypothetical protein
MATSNSNSEQSYISEGDQPSDSERRRRSLQGAEEGQQEQWGAGSDARGGGTWQRWWPVQAGFVDDPRGALSQAQGLVNEAVAEAVRRLESERDGLEQSWSRDGDDVSTEDLRRALQRYRDLYARLLGTTPGNPGAAPA